MECKNLEELLSPYLENELSPGEKRKVKEHLKTCEDCSLLLSLLKEMKESLADFPELEVSDRLLKKLYVVPRKKRLFRMSLEFMLRPALQPVLAVATIFMVILSFYFFHPDKDFINKSIDRQLHLGYSKLQELYVQAGSLKDEVGEYTTSFVRSFKKLNPWGKPKE